MSDSTKIIKVKKDKEGEIIEVILEDGRILPINHAILMAKDGLIEGAIVARGKDGGEFLRTDPNDLAKYHLNNLPAIKDLS